MSSNYSSTDIPKLSDSFKTTLDQSKPFSKQLADEIAELVRDEDIDLDEPLEPDGTDMPSGPFGAATRWFFNKFH